MNITHEQPVSILHLIGRDLEGHDLVIIGKDRIMRRGPITQIIRPRPAQLTIQTSWMAKVTGINRWVVEDDAQKVLELNEAVDLAYMEENRRISIRMFSGEFSVYIMPEGDNLSELAAAGIEFK